MADSIFASWDSGNASKLDYISSGDIRISGGMVVGSIAIDPTPGTLKVVDDVQFDADLNVDGAASFNSSMTVYGDLSSAGKAGFSGLRIEKSATYSSGAGVEFGYGSSVGTINCVDRTGGSATRELDITANPLKILTGDVRIAAGLYVGGTSTDPDSGDVWALNDIRVGGGVHIGATDTNPTNGTLTIEQSGIGATSLGRGLTFIANSSGTPGIGFGTQMHWALQDSTTEAVDAATITVKWTTATHGSQKGEISFFSRDATGGREGFAIGTNGSAALISFFGGVPAAKPTVTGSRGGNAALASLLSALAGLSLLTDSSSA